MKGVPNCLSSWGIFRIFMIFGANIKLAAARIIPAVNAATIEENMVSVSSILFPEVNNLTLP